VRGEVPRFTDYILVADGVTWGVVLDTDSGAVVHSAKGEFLFDLPIRIHAEAVYAEDLILAADWGDPPDHLERVLMVKQDGTIAELTTTANGFGAFGTALHGTIYITLEDGGIGTFDTDGQPGPVLSPTVGFVGVVAANDYLYAYSGGPPGTVGQDTVVHVFDSSGTEINQVELGGSAVRVGPTALGIAADVFAHVGQEGIAAVAMAPNGTSLATLSGLHDGAGPTDSLAWEHGRYLIGLDATSEAVQLRLFRLDGEPLDVSAPFEYRNWPPSRPAGTVLALVGSDGTSVDFRSLSGSLLGNEDYSGDAAPDIETIDGNDQYVWVTTTNPTQTLYTVHIYDLGECSGTPEPGTFLDDDWSIFEGNIEWLAEARITYGCNPAEVNTRFCPDEPLTRGQMAALLYRALGDSIAPTNPPISFTDTADSIFGEAIEWLSGAEITRGCGPETFCPDDAVTRGQMAAFLARALELPRVIDPGRFIDDDNSVFEGDIASLAAAGITSGCGVDRFCPNDFLTRGEMAAFLQRALGS
jgi:hypothetical protein